MREFGLGFLAAASLVVSPAAAADTFLETVAPCARAQDRAMCILRALVAKDGGGGVRRDADLRSQPAIMSTLGLTAEPVAAADGQNAVERIFSASEAEAKAAADQALALDRAGKDPAAALAPVLALSLVGAPAPPFPAEESLLPAPRALAYGRLLTERDTVASASERLRAAAADAWERDIRDPQSPRAFKGWTRALFLARLHLRDRAGAERALALTPSPFERAEMLADAGLLEEGVKAALALDRKAAEVFVRAEMTARAQTMIRIQEVAARTATRRLLDELRSRGVDDPEIAKAARKLQAQEQASLESWPAPRISQADVESETDDRTARMQDHILRVGVQRNLPEAVRPLADRLLQDRDLLTNRYRLPLALKTATPAAASEWLADMEAELTPQGDANRLDRLVAAWTELGRTDRAEALVDRAAAWARAGSARRPSPYAQVAARLLWSRGRQTEAMALAPLTPADKLKLDIAAGRGLSGYDAYVAEATESERITLVVGCAYAAAQSRDWPLVLGCVERERSLLREPIQRHNTSGVALERAAEAAAAGDLISARRLFEIAAEEGSAALDADPRLRRLPDPFAWGTLKLLAYAKAELRADGRLPKSPAPPEP